MKKRVLLVIFLILVLVSSLAVSLVAFAEESDVVSEKGSVSGLSEKKNGYFYTNKTFTYAKHENADGFLYWSYSITDFFDVVEVHEDGVRDYVLADAGSTEKTDDDIEIEVDDLTTDAFYVFVDFYSDESGDPADNKYSNVTIVCVDLTAPVVNVSKLFAWLTDSANETGFENAWISGKDNWEFPVEWAYDLSLDIVEEETAVVTVEEKDEDENPVSVTKNSSDLLNIYVQYLSASGFYDDEWEDCEGETSFDLDSVGIWRFRFVVKDAAGNVAQIIGDANLEDIIGETLAQKVADGTYDLEYVLEIQRNVRDTTPPTIKYTTTQKKVSTVGTVAGKAYSIPTSPTVIDEMGSVTTTYQVFKKLNPEDEDGVLIYDSKTKKVTEGYEDFISNGILTPGLNEDTKDKSDGTTGYIYYVIHTATDNFGNSATSERLNIKVTPPDANAYDVWKIVLISVACAAAAGIIVLIFIKPREQAFAPQRVEIEPTLSDKTQDSGNSEANQKSKDKTK